MFERLPEVIGLYADPNYKDTHYIETLLNMVPPKSIVVLPVLNRLDRKLANAAIVRFGTDRVKEWIVTEVDQVALRKSENDALADYMFLSYLKFFVSPSGRSRSHLYIFPYAYNQTDSVSYSTRIQNMIIKAHLLGVQYTVVRQGELDDFFKNNSDDEGNI